MIGPLVDWDWVLDHLDDIAFRLGQHLWLTLLAVAIGFAISFVLSLAAARRAALYGPITGLAGVLYTIPSLALFAALVPIFGFSELTAIVPLVLYTLLILVRNIVAGFRGVPREVLEAADGMGYTRSRRLWSIELPLAVPLIVAGVRLATVSTIGLVTISAILGDNFGGLGFFIDDGFTTFFTTKIVVGTVLSVALAVAADVALVRLERALTPWARARATRAIG